MGQGADQTRKDNVIMAHKQFILITMVVLMVLSLAGCGESNRSIGANRRWQRVLEQARLDAAMQSIEQGRLEYAIRLLEDLIESESAFAEQAKQILTELRAVTQEFAQARAMNTETKKQSMVN